MERKEQMDGLGTAALIAFALLLALNQVVIKVVNDGLSPAFFAGIRSLCAAFLVWGWIRLRGRRLDFMPGTFRAGILIGVIFSVEFLGLFIALDLTTVVRTSVIFYSMPLWLAIAAHVLIPGDKIHPVKGLGLIAAFLGVAWAIVDRHGANGGQASLLGDFAALIGAMGWAGIVLMARVSPLARVRPEMQHFWQLAVSTPILLLAAPFFGPLIRDFQPVHLAGVAFQIVVIASAAFLFWMWMLTIYPASSVASFSFLSPIFGVLLGWLLLGEHINPSILVSGGLVALGIYLINRPPRPARVRSP